MFDKILVPLDGSELAAKVLPQVARVLDTGGSVRAIRVLDGYTTDDMLLRGIDPYGPANKQLGHAMEPFESSGAKVTWDVYVGDPATRILEDAAEWKPGIIAMATHGRTGGERWIRGSVAERVLRRSPFPLLLANPRVQEGGFEFKRILVPIDGSPLSEEILPAVRELAQKFPGARVFLVRVLEEGEDVFAARAATEMTARKLAGIDVHPRVIVGSPAIAILDLARDEGADLIAMTTHGRSGPSRWVFGSVAENVIRHASLPLLVVRTAGVAPSETPSETTAQHA